MGEVLCSQSLENMKKKFNKEGYCGRNKEYLIEFKVHGGPCLF